MCHCILRKNYNGQLTGQYGIHGFWESRLPELFTNDYDLLVGKASYIESPAEAIWAAVTQAHMAVDSVLGFEKELTEQLRPDKKYSFEERGASFVQVYSLGFSRQYHVRLDGMVKRQMKSSISMVANFWYTSWVDAGQPDLSNLEELSEEARKALSNKKKSWLERMFQARPHESTLNN